MQCIKDLLVREPVLKYFDVMAPTQLQVDASQSGLGAVLLQDGHPVAYASRSLTAAELNYPQIDKELLAIVFSCEKIQPRCVWEAHSGGDRSSSFVSHNK